MANQALPEQLRLGHWRAPDTTRGVRPRHAAYGIVTDLAKAGWAVKRDRRVWPERGWWQ